MGDLRARDMVAICIDVMRSATEQRQGTVIKTMGDEVMATFPSADEALNAAAQMQQQISSHAQLKVDGQPVAIRIGCHFGPVMLENRDVFGATVHTANRMTSQAKAGQIITTAATVERLSPEWRASCRQIDIATSRGRGARSRSTKCCGRPKTSPAWCRRSPMNSRPVRAACACGCAVEDRELMLDEQHPSITIGRAEDNDVVIKGNLISRLHARIEISRNKFVLIDQSTNGTFVQTADGEESFVRRDSLQIKGEGMIGLGRAARAGLAADDPLRLRGEPERRRRRRDRRGFSPSRCSDRLQLLEQLRRQPRCRTARGSRGCRATSLRHSAGSTLSSACSASRADVEALGVQILGARQVADRASRSRRPCRRSDPASTPARAGSRRSPATGTCPARRGGTS